LEKNELALRYGQKPEISRLGMKPFWFILT